MNYYSTCKLEILNWQQIASAVETLNPALSKQVSQLELTEKHKLYKITYPCETMMAQSGILHLPNDKGQLVSIYDETVTPEIQKDLGYHDGYVPYGLVFSRGVELFFKNLGETDFYSFQVLLVGDLIQAFAPKPDQKEIKVASLLNMMNTAPCELIFFSRAWFDSKGPGFDDFKTYMMTEADGSALLDGLDFLRRG